MWPNLNCVAALHSRYRLKLRRFHVYRPFITSLELLQHQDGLRNTGHSLGRHGKEVVRTRDDNPRIPWNAKLDLARCELRQPLLQWNAPLISINTVCGTTHTNERECHVASILGAGNKDIELVTRVHMCGADIGNDGSDSFCAIFGEEIRSSQESIQAQRSV